jgi:hypothetical protein
MKCDHCLKDCDKPQPFSFKAGDPTEYLCDFCLTRAAWKKERGIPWPEHGSKKNED